MKENTVLIKTSDAMLHLSKKLALDIRSLFFAGEPELPQCLQTNQEQKCTPRK